MAESDRYFLTSKRLGFRRWTEEDERLAASLWGDPRVTRLIDARSRLSFQQVHDRLAEEIRIQQYHGVQYWPLFELGNGRFIGCCGLHPKDVKKAIFEIGVHLRHDEWGKGYASESASSIMTYAFESLGVSTLFAGHSPRNEVSRHLLGKLGFTYSHDELYPPTGCMHPSYLLAQEAFRSRQPDRYQ